MSDSVTYPQHSYGVIGPTQAAIDTGIAAAGTTQGTATQLLAGTSVVTTVAASAGVRLPTLACYDVVVINRGANDLSVYPPFGDNIEGLAANAALLIAPNNAAVFDCPNGPQATAQGLAGTWIVR